MFLFGICAVLPRRSLRISQNSQDPVALKAAARIALKRQIVQALVGSSPELSVMTLEPQLEQLLLSSVQQAQKGWR